MLADRCDSVLAVDASSTALGAAAQSCEHLGHVTFQPCTLPQQSPEGSFGLIVVSEVLYYFDRDNLQSVAARCMGALTPRAEIISCHWLGETDYPRSGIDASEAFAQSIGKAFKRRVIHHDETYRLESFAR